MNESERPGARIHHTDPFATPAHLRSPARRLRGRLPAPVTIWTAGGEEERTGLTMSSVLVAEGEPSLIVGLMNDTSDLWDVIQATRSWVVHVLSEDSTELAERFAGRRPSPGGLFVDVDVEASEFGPVLPRFSNRAYCRLLDVSAAGYQRLIRGSIERIETDEFEDPLLYFRGGYKRLG